MSRVYRWGISGSCRRLLAITLSVPLAARHATVAQDADFVCSIHYPRDDWRSSRDSPDDSKELRNKTKGPSRRFAGPTPLWRAAWCSRSATKEATPTVIWAIDIVSEAPSVGSSFVSTPRGARSDRRLLRLKISVAIFCGKLSSLSRISEDAGGCEGRGSKHC